jgi:hypothetical protein
MISDEKKISENKQKRPENQKPITEKLIKQPVHKKK